MNAYTHIDRTLTAAQNAGNGSDVSTTCQLLQALSKHERDSDLGLLIAAILQGGDYYAKSAADMESVEFHAEEIRKRADLIADAYEASAAYHMQPLEA